MSITPLYMRIILFTLFALVAPLFAGNLKTPNNGGFHRYVYSPNGKWIAGAFTPTNKVSGGNAVLWPAKGGAYRELGDQDSSCVWVGFSHNGKCLAALDVDGSLSLYAVPSGKKIKRIKITEAYNSYGSHVQEPALDAKGKHFITVGSPKSRGESGMPFSELVAWDISTAKRSWITSTKQVEAKLENIQVIRFLSLATSVNGKWVAARVIGVDKNKLKDGSKSKSPKIVNYLVVLAAKTGTVERCFPSRPEHCSNTNGPDGTRELLTISADCKMLAYSSGTDHKLMVHDFETGKLMHELSAEPLLGGRNEIQISGASYALNFSSKGKSLGALVRISGKANGQTNMWNIALVWSLKKGKLSGSSGRPPIHALALDPTHKRVLIQPGEKPGEMFPPPPTTTKLGRFRKK